MKEGILTAERIILESLFQGKKSVSELCSGTGLNSSIVINIIKNFLRREILERQSNHIAVISQKKESLLKSINCKQHIKIEVKEIFSSIIDCYFSKKKSDEVQLGMKKNWLSDKNKKIFKAQIYNLNSFVESIEQENKTETSDPGKKTVVIWGYSPYSELVNQSLII